MHPPPPHERWVFYSSIPKMLASALGAGYQCPATSANDTSKFPTHPKCTPGSKAQTHRQGGNKDGQSSDYFNSVIVEDGSMPEVIPQESRNVLFFTENSSNPFFHPENENPKEYPPPPPAGRPIYSTSTFEGIGPGFKPRARRAVPFIAANVENIYHAESAQRE